MYSKLIIFLFILTFMACQSTGEEARETKPLKKEGIEVNETEAIIPIKEEDIENIENESDGEKKNVFRYYDEVYAKTIAWNKAIDEQNQIDLENLYAKNIMAYGRRLSKSALVKEKMNWFAKHPNYHQKIGKQFDVYFKEIILNGKETIVYGSSFDKITIENGQEKTYRAELLFKEENGQLKINVETDRTSNLNIESKTKGITLPDGKYYFAIDAFDDTRREENFAHEQVRVSSEINFEIKNGKIKEGLEYTTDRYSGYMRSIFTGIILNGEIDGDKIHFETAYYTNRDDYDLEYLKEKKRDYVTIKVINKDKIIVLEPKQGQTIPLTVGDYMYSYPNK